MEDVIILFAGFLVLAIISRHTIRSLRSRGLYRLVAWMGIWALFVLNWRVLVPESVFDQPVDFLGIPHNFHHPARDEFINVKSCWKTRPKQR